MHVLEHQLARVARAQRELPFLVAGLEALAVRGHDEAANRPLTLVAVGLGPHDRDLCGGSVRDPHLAAIEEPGTVRLFLRHRDHAGRIRAKVRLRETEAANDLAARHLRQPRAFLIFAAEGEDGIHRQCPLYGGQGAHAGVAAFELLHDQTVRDVVEARATVLLRQIGAEDAQLRHLGHELFRETAVDVALPNDGKHAVVDEVADAVAYGALVLRQLTIDVEEIEHGGKVISHAYGHARCHPSRAALRPMRPSFALCCDVRSRVRRANGATPTSLALARNFGP